MKVSQVLGLTFSVSLLATPALAQPENPQQQPQPSEQAPPEGQARPMQRPQQELMRMPQQARDTIDRHVGAGQIDSIEREQHDGKTVYDVEYRAQDGTKHELKVDDQGRVIEKERS